jgi:hypothetical protein
VLDDLLLINLSTFGDAVDAFLMMLVDDTVNHAVHPVLKNHVTLLIYCLSIHFTPELPH